MTNFFASDLHGGIDRYQKLFKAIEKEHPQSVFLGGDLLPSALRALTAKGHPSTDFIKDFLVKELNRIKEELQANYPRIFLILGNDDSRAEEAKILEAEKRGLWSYIPNKKMSLGQYQVYGYSYIPPSPFLLKDWERYDVSRYVDPGSISPEEGFRSVHIPENEVRNATISEDLKLLAGETDLSLAIFLFHAPPYKTKLDRAALDGKMIDHVPLDVHVGSIAIQRFIEARQPLLTLHGHIHESARMTKSWRDRIGKTHAFSAAHDGPELALIRFDFDNLNNATRELI